MSEETAQVGHIETGLCSDAPSSQSWLQDILEFSIKDWLLLNKALQGGKRQHQMLQLHRAIYRVDEEASSEGTSTLSCLVQHPQITMVVIDGSDLVMHTNLDRCKFVCNLAGC